MTTIGIYLLLLTAVVTAQNYRLSGDTKPTSYVLEIRDIMRGTFIGTMTAEFEVFKTTKEIVLHENGLAFGLFGEVDTHTVQQVDPSEGGQILVTNAETKNDGTNQHVVTVNVDLIPGNTYKLIIKYFAPSRSTPYGFYYWRYSPEFELGFSLGLTQFATTSARNAFPCWDEPGMKATFKLSVEYPQDYTVLSHTRAEGVPIVPENPMMKIEFSTSARMSPHALPWAIMTERDKKSSSDGRITIWTSRGLLPQAEPALQAAIASVQQLENYLNSGTGTPRLVDKLDLIVAPLTLYPGINNWGVQIYRETGMLFEPSESSTFEYQRVWQLVAHEASRQWFGDLVTPAWWDEIWLSEGLNCYFEYWALSMVQKEWQMDEQFVVQQTQVALQADWYSGTYSNIHVGKHADRIHPLIFQNVSTPEEINNVFDIIITGKGGSIIRMLHALLGEEKFQEAIRAYLVTNAEKSVTSDDLWTAMELKMSSGVLPMNVTLKQVMDTWTKQIGFPVISAERNYNTGSVDLKQTVFLFPPHEAIDTPRWMIPVSISWTNSTSTSNVWLLQEQLNVNLPSVSRQKWLLLNKDHTGFYRVNYDTRNWQLLSESLLDLSPSSRAMLLDDALNLARAGRLDYVTALDVTELLPNETHFAPWSAALTGLGYLYDRLSNDTESRKIIEDYILEKLVYVYDYVRGFDVAPGDSHVMRLTRQLVLEWACRLSHEKCIEDAGALFRSWIEKPTPNPIHPDLRYVTYCTGIRTGGRIEFELLRKRYAESSTQDKPRIVSALGCANDTEILAEYLLDSIYLGSGIDGRQIFTAVCQTPLGVDLALEFFTIQWFYIDIIYGEEDVLKILSEDIAPKLNTPEQLKQLQLLLLLGGRLFENYKVVEPVELAIGTLEDTLFWQENHREEVVGVMGGYKRPPSSASSIGISVFLLFLSLALFIAY